METKKLNFSKIAAIIIAVCAIGIIIIKYFTNGDMDSYILPFILLFVSVVFFSQKPKKEVKQVDVNSTKGRIILFLASIAFVSGVVVFFSTLL